MVWLNNFFASINIFILPIYYIIKSIISDIWLNPLIKYKSSNSTLSITKSISNVSEEIIFFT